jgi:hypothetical protein
VAFINLWSTNIDPQVWPEPNTFLPERHLNDTGKFVKSEKLLTFGLGKIFEILFDIFYFIYLFDLYMKIREKKLHRRNFG